MPQAKAGGRDRSAAGSRSGGLPLSEFRVQKSEVRTRSGGLPCPPELSSARTHVPAVMKIKSTAVGAGLRARPRAVGFPNCFRLSRSPSDEGAGEPNAMRRDWGREKIESLI